MALTTAEKNKRKRERKKRERAEAQKQLLEEQHDSQVRSEGMVGETSYDAKVALEDVEIEYVAEPLLLFPVAPVSNGEASIDENGEDSTHVAVKNNDGNVRVGGNDQDLEAIVRRFQDRAAVVYVTDDELNGYKNNDDVRIKKESPNDDDNKNSEKSGATLSKRKLKDMLRPSVAELKQRVTRPELVEAHDVTAPDPDFLIYLKGIPGTVPVPRHWGRKRKYLQGKVRLQTLV